MQHPALALHLSTAARNSEPTCYDGSRESNFVARQRWSFAVVSITAIVALLVGASPATAAPPSAVSSPGIATFQGRIIDLKESWQGAQSCIVFEPQHVECFTTAAEADARTGYVREKDPLVIAARRAGLSSAALPSCASRYLCLWEAINGGGRRLQFANEYWQDLAGYGFSNVMSSWRNNSYSDDWGSVFDNGGKGQLDISPVTYSSNVGTYWNDTADQVYG